MAELVLKNCKVDGEITDITIKDGKIFSIGKNRADGEDIGGKRVYPGLFDIHCHGVMGYDTMDGDKLREMSEFLLYFTLITPLPPSFS